MPVITEYRIRDIDGGVIVTDNTELAEQCARNNCRVTARTAGYTNE